MNNRIDNRDQSWQVQATAMALFARAVGAEETLFSTNGSTENVHVAIMTAVRPGETIAIARNGHKSAFAGLVLSGAWPVYVDPVYDERWQVAHGVDPLQLDRVLAEHPQARAAMVFAPSDYGVSSDVKALARVAHAQGIPLLTDDAWGLDYSFCTRLPPSALESGSDLAISSVHKTLSGLGQTSVLSVQGELIDRERLHRVLELEQSMSASALVVAAIDAARHLFQRHGERLLGQAIDRAHRLRAEIRRMPGLVLMGEEVLGPGAAALDPTRVTLDVVGLGLTGYAAADWLQQHCGIHMKLSDHRRLMALISNADTDETIDRLIDGLHALISHRDDAGHGGIPEMPAPAQLRTETVMLPRDAFLGASDMVPWRQAAGRVSAEMISPYPSGVPVVAPGELFTLEIVDYLREVANAGGMLEGAVDASVAELRVVATYMTH
jgi:arginine decarboxylase